MRLDAAVSRCRSSPIAICLATLPLTVGEKIGAAWGSPEDDPDVQDGAFRFRAQKFGNVIVALPPDRGRPNSRRADYHDPSLPPRHALLAFGLWLRHIAGIDAIVHMGAHGTLEWLPGKAVALTAACFPEAVVGPIAGHLSVHRQQSGRGRAGQAPDRRGDARSSAATARSTRNCPATRANSSGWSMNTPRPTGSIAAAANVLARLIVECAQHSGLAREAGVDAQADPDEALRRIDAWLCDLKDLAIKDGQHIYGRAPNGKADPARKASVDNERRGLIDALDGKRIAAGPAGSPHRERRGRAADRPQHVHRRSAHLADADRDGSGPARRRRGRSAAICRVTARCRARW